MPLTATTRPHGRLPVRAWHGGPDPLAPPYDVRAAVDEVGRDVLAGGSLREALRDLLRRGPDGRRGLDDLRRAGPPDAPRAARRGRPRRRRRPASEPLLDQALAAERDALAGRDDDAARFAEWSWTPCRDDTAGAGAGAVRLRLAATDEARAAYQQILDVLRSEVLDAQFAGLKQALSSGTRRRMQAVRDMLADLNALLAAHARGEDTTDQFAEFMDKHGEFFPEQPAGRRRADRRAGPPPGRRGAADALALAASSARSWPS